jgi:hypothetical protein
MPKKQHKRHKDDAVSVLEVLAAKQQEETEDAEDERVDPLFPAMLMELLPGGMDLAEVRKLLEAGADVEVVNEAFGTPLVYACSQCTMGNGHFKPQYEALVRLLLSFGADANRPVWKGHARDTPLCRASVAGNVNVVRLLLDHGASVDLAGANGTTTPLCVACDVVQTRARHDFLLPVIRLLLERGANLDVLSNRTVGRRETQRRLTVFQMVRYFGRPVLRKVVRAHLARTIRLTAKRSKIMAPHVARFLV